MNDKVIRFRIKFIKQHGFNNLSEFARAVGEDATNVHKIVKGRQKPSIQKIFRWAKVLDCDYEDLIYLFYTDEFCENKNRAVMIKDWYEIEHDVDKTVKRVIKIFERWYKHGNLNLVYGNGKTVEDIFGFPYTSTSTCAMISNVQADAVLDHDNTWSFKYCAIDERRNVYAWFSRDLETKYVKIGNLEEYK